MVTPDTSNTIVIVPARMSSTRLPGKPLADICGQPMIVHVWRRAIEAGVGPVLVAVAEQEIVDVVAAAGGDAVVTDPDLPSGSDRICAALQARDPNRQFRFIINLQGDLPLMDPKSISQCLAPLANEGMQISTLAAEITDREEIANPDVVKALADFTPGSDVAVAQDFVRQVPEDASGPFWHHIGIYAYRREALEAFVGLPVSPRERERKLEQMRAMDNGLPIAVVRVDTIPFGVDTPADLDRARREIGETQDTI
ncbi:MAG: 3-deoxy-manno-octulosonate cytidylyltransferase [Hyphomicrobiales bacterium]|nr:3-deoxy-manno-octulosonate cytidylyltransferase [Hyphomicrobiales bacterium]